MGKHRLFPHPDFPTSAVKSVRVDLDRSEPGVVSLWYTVFGSIDRIAFPPERIERRADGLWEETCFEIFVRGGAGAEYSEFNFSPSTEWAAYRFQEYRGEAKLVALPHAPIISRFCGGWFELHVTLPLDLSACSYRLQLSAVIKERSGHKSYWALAHPPSGTPDFHDPACFTLELSPAPQSSPRT